jgi:hypothetical protein
MSKHGSAGARQTAQKSDGRLSADELHTITSHLAVQEDLWRPQVVHDRAARWHSQLLWSPQVEIWLIGWHAGQNLDLHDHGGASGAFTVCEGTIEVRQGSSSQPYDEVRQRTLRKGDTVTFDGEYIHEVANRYTTPATTIHAFSPALATMGYYETVAGELIVARRETMGAPEPSVVATPVAAGRA